MQMLTLVEVEVAVGLQVVMEERAAQVLSLLGTTHRVK
jgi:hypothetical protein